MPARLCGSSASASALRDGAADPGVSPLGHRLGDQAPAPGAPQGRNPRAGGRSRAAAGRAAPTLPRGSQREARRRNIHVLLFGGSPVANPSLRVPAEGTSPAPARVTKAGDKGLFPSSPGQHPRCGSWGPPGASVNLETLPGSHGTSAGDNNKLLFQIRERGTGKGTDNRFGGGQITYYSQKWAWGYF